MTQYNPIACSVYDLLERAAFLHSVVAARVRNEDGSVIDRELRVMDVFSKEKAEFLKAVDVRTNETITVRLDHIVLSGDGSSTHLMDRC